MTSLSIRERARRYIASIHSISGSGGNGALFQAALALRRGFDLSLEEAMIELAIWNSINAQPPWRDSDLLRKLHEAGKANKPAGYLVGDQGVSFKKPSSPRPSVDSKHEESEERAAKRKRWPTFRVGTKAELKTVANLRAIHPGIPSMAQELGLLRFTETKIGEPCFVIREETLAQVRRMDGRPFVSPEGSLLKSRNLPGSIGKWLGYGMLENHRDPPVLIVEGLIGWMEAAEAIATSDFPQWLPFAALSASVKLEERELALLAGRRVIIARDRGIEGLRAAKRWQAELASVGIEARYWTPPQAAGLKADLGDALKIPGFNPSQIFRQD